MKRVFIEILTESKQQFYPELLDRDIVLNPDIKKVQTIVGPRRAGKSSLLKLAVLKLLKQGIKWDKICYLSFEDERLSFDTYQPDIILQAFRELHPGNVDLKDVYFLFDEIQYLPRWEYFINRIYETVSKNIILTGSNSSTLHTNVLSVLRGRGLPYELLPLSFNEYLRFRNIAYEEFGPQKSVVMAAFNEYMFWGGYPELVFSDVKNKRSILQEYFNTVLFRDVLEQKAGNSSYVRYLFHRIAANTGKNISLRKIFLELKSRGFQVSLGSIYNMADIAENVYLFKRIGKFDGSLIKRENADKKGYFIDNGLLHAINNSFSVNTGAMLENLIFWHLYRIYGNIYTNDIYYYHDNYHECDFVLYNEGSIPLPVQVCVSLKDENTRQREIKGLVKACLAGNVKRGVIITLDEEEKFTANHIEISVLPAWKWCANVVKLQEYLT